MLNFVLYILLWLGAPASTPSKVEICLSSEEAKLYELINDYRKKKKLKPIPFSAKLSMVAQIHAKDLADHFDFSKVNECNPHSWSANGNWTSCCYTNDHKQAECMWNKPREIAGYEGDGFEIAYYSSAGANAEQGLEGWKKSPAHNPLIINSGMWKDIEWGGVGIGLYKEYGVVWFGREVDEQNKIVQCEE